ncbi:499_t:CDS:2, partial [Acaulospora colombiana]
LKKILQPDEDQSYYHVVCGEHGTGKTTLTRIASREKILEDFGIAFGQSLNFAFEECISFTEHFMMKILGHTNTLEAFKRASAVYEAKHNKPPVIVYDNIAKLVSVNPKVLDTLQDDAKMNADHRKYIAVFVSGEGSVPRRMEYKPVIEIGDLSEEESMEYLVDKRKINSLEAKKLYDLIGGRIVELKSTADKFQAKQPFEAQVFGTVYDNLEKAEMNPRQPYHESAKIIIRALLNSDGMIHVSKLREMAKVEPSKLLDGKC